MNRSHIEIETDNYRVSCTTVGDLVHMTINTGDHCISYIAIGDRDALMDAAYDKHGVCGVTVRPA